jgi:DNA-binding CsgD family transcriptional regulator
MKVSLTGNIMLTAADKIAAICGPLSQILEVPFFRYGRIFNDGSRFSLCSKPDVMRYFYEEQHYHLSWHDNGNPASAYPSGRLVWAVNKLSSTPEQRVMENEMKKIFQLAEGVTYRIKTADFVEIYDFASHDFSIYHLDPKILYRFMFYFKEQARVLIKQAESHKLIIPSNDLSLPPCDVKNKEEKFLDNISVKRYYITEKGEDVYLTDREVDCLYWYARGKSAKEIAIIFNKSEKTINRHLENIRQKLNCHKQAELIRLAEEMGL